MTSSTHIKAAELGSFDIDSAKKAIQNAAPAVIASKTESDSIPTDKEYIQKPLIIETKITPEPAKPRVQKVLKPKVVVNTPKEVTPSINIDGAEAHRFPYGYCTYYVSSRRFVPWSGNAITWLTGARSYGFSTGDTPAVGAILVTSEGGRAGHVAMVDAVGDGTITISEMNYAGWGVTSSRTISTSYGPIMGYIY